MNSPEEKAKELIDKFKPMMYCYMGSGMLSNDYDEKVATDNAKQCAIILCDSHIEETKNWFNFYSMDRHEFYQSVKQAIIKL